MKQATGKTERGHGCVAGGCTQHADTKTEQDNTYIFHTGIGQNFFHILLADGIHHPENAGDNTQSNDDLAEKNRCRCQQEVEPDDTVDADFDHHA